MLKLVDEQVSAPHASAEPLYLQVLGSHASRVHSQVAALHCSAGTVTAEGWLRVERGSGWFSRAVAAAAGLPRPGARVHTRLEIVRGPDHERWLRRFGDAAVVRSRQKAGHAGELVERFGVLALVFRLQVVGQGLRFQQRACQLRSGPVVLPVPGWLAPRVCAAVSAAPDGGVAVSVRVRSRWTGLLLAYSGTVAIREGRT